MPTLDHFGLVAPFYERLIPLRNPDRLIELLGLPIKGALLDVGGGTGRVAQAFTQLAHQVVVADFSIKMLQEATLKHYLQSTNSPSERLPFANQTFERVLMVDALHHVFSQVETAGELWRVVKPGGRIVIEEPDLRNLLVKFVAVAEKLALMRSHFLPPPKIANLFPYPNARLSIEKEGFNAWVIVDKLR